MREVSDVRVYYTFAYIYIYVYRKKEAEIHRMTLGRKIKRGMESLRELNDKEWVVEETES